MGKEIWLDPTEEEVKQSSGSMVYAGMPALGTMTSVWQTGKMSTQEAFDVSCLFFLSPFLLIASILVHGGL